MKEKLKKDIGIKLRNFRKSLRLTQAEMVSNFDIGRANYSRIEKGEVFPNVTILHKLKTNFNLSLNWLIGDEQETNDDQLLQGQKPKKKIIDFVEGNSEIEELLQNMERIPMIKHAVLGFFMEQRMKHDDLIKKMLGEKEKNEQKVDEVGESEDCKQLQTKA